MSEARQITTLIVLDSMNDADLLARISTADVKFVKAGANIRGYRFDKIVTCLTPFNLTEQSWLRELPKRLCPGGEMYVL